MKIPCLFIAQSLGGRLTVIACDDLKTDQNSVRGMSGKPLPPFTKSNFDARVVEIFCFQGDLITH